MQIPRFVGEFGYLLKKKKERNNGNLVVFNNMLLLPSAHQNKKLVGRSKILLLRQDLVLGTLPRKI